MARAGKGTSPDALPLAVVYFPGSVLRASEDAVGAVGRAAPARMKSASASRPPAPPAPPKPDGSSNCSCRMAQRLAALVDLPSIRSAPRAARRVGASVRASRNQDAPAFAPSGFRGGFGGSAEKTGGSGAGGVLGVSSLIAPHSLHALDSARLCIFFAFGP